MAFGIIYVIAFIHKSVWWTDGISSQHNCPPNIEYLTSWLCILPSMLFAHSLWILGKWIWMGSSPYYDHNSLDHLLLPYDFDSQSMHPSPYLISPPLILPLNHNPIFLLNTLPKEAHSYQPQAIFRLSAISWRQNRCHMQCIPPSLI